MFTLDAQLKADTHHITDLELCSVLLMDNALFSWVILVPRMPELAEITDLPRDKQHQLIDEIAQVSDALQALTHADKMNVAALGNMVRQLHIHVIARFKGDAAWPNPVWGVEREAYDTETRAEMIEALTKNLPIKA